MNNYNISKKKILESLKINNNILYNDYENYNFDNSDDDDSLDSLNNSKLNELDNTINKKLLTKSIKILNWWTSASKVIIIDNETKAKFEIAIEEVSDGKFNLYQKNKQLVGKATYWVDKDNIIPQQFKHNDIVQDQLTGRYIYIYELNYDSKVYHDLPKKIYKKYYYNKEFNCLKITNEINEKF